MANHIEEIVSVNQYVLSHKTEFNIEIGNKIKEIRIAKNISLEQMAEMTFMSVSYLSQIEKGINGITLNKFIIICNALEITANEILEVFIFSVKEDMILNKLQIGKDLSKNILEYLKEH